jgi:hypothetical protein
MEDSRRQRLDAKRHLKFASVRQMEIREEACYSTSMVGKISHSRFSAKPVAPGGGVRLGSSSRGNGRKLVIGIGAAAAIALSVVIVLIVRTHNTSHAPISIGCRNDSDCSDGRFCAKGGCIVLLPSEHRGIWRDDIEAQQADASSWRPTSEVGEHLPGNSVCPVPESTVPTPPVDKTRLLSVVYVFEVNRREIIHHRYLKATSAVWLDALRFEFRKIDSLNPALICGSPNAAGIKIESEPNEGVGIDLMLKNAVPSGKAAIAGVSFRQNATPPDSMGEQTLSVELAAPNMSMGRAHTIVAFPLGTEILSIAGNTPTREKLLKGYVIYDFFHGDHLETATFRYKIGAAVSDRPLDVTTESL